MIKILITGITDNIGGVETFFINYFRSMQKYGKIIFDVMCYTENPAFKEEIVENGGKIFVIPSVRNPLKSRSAIDKYLKNHSSEYTAMWCNKCDLFNIDFLKVARKYDIPHIILHSHNSFNMYSGKKKAAVSVMHAINKRLIHKYATDFWACSDYAADWMFSKQINKEGQVQFIPNAVNADRFRFNAEKRCEYRKKLGIDEKMLVGSIGRLTYQKNPFFALEIFDQIYKQNPNAVFVIVGNGDMEKEVKEKAQGLLCSEAIKFLGMREDVSELMQAMDCLLLPSHFEGLPVVAVEAQSAGLAVFAASDGITAQTKLTDLMHFIPLSAGPKKWADEILDTRLKHRDTFGEIINSGFEITQAGKVLYNRFVIMQNGE